LPDEGLRWVANVSGTNGSSPANGSTRHLIAQTTPPAQAVSGSGIKAAIVGFPRWKRADVASVAQREGAAAALLRAYESLDLDLFSVLEGSFALVIADPQRRRLVAAVDRFGIQRLCIAETPSGVAFSENAESLTQHPAVGGDIAPEALYHYLFFHVIPSPLTVFSRVRKIPPGHYCLADSGGTKLVRYWSPKFNDGGDAPTDTAARLHSALRDAVRACEPDQTTGAFLSGGLDSSAVAGMLREVAGKPVPTYSIGFRADGFDEIEYARITAKHFGTEAHEYYVSPADVRDAVPLIATAYDEPFGNASAVPVYFCAREAAARGNRKLLAGDGGDEIFGGNTRYAKQQVFAAYDRVPRSVRSGLLEPLLLSRPMARNPLRLLRKASSYVSQARQPMPDRLESYNLFNLTSWEEVLSEDFRRSVDRQSAWQSLREAYRSTSATSMTDRMLWLDWKITLADNDLRKVETMSRLAGVEVRYPMLDEAVVDLSLELSPRQKVRGSALRPFFKDATRGWLPDATLSKSKHGFGLPFGVWMAEDRALAELANDALSSFRNRRIVEPAFIDRLLDRHAADHATYFGTFVWVLMMLELWLAKRRPVPAQ
jgi:asparagine synthase (glutamine-hydrolysing)